MDRNNLITLAVGGKINEEANIRDKQSTIVNARIETVWSVLTDISTWPVWNQDITAVSEKQITEGLHFNWSMSSVSCQATIQKVQFERLISWTGVEGGKKIIQVWKLTPSDGNQTIITCEKSIEGFRSLFYSPQKLHSTLLNWLARLKQCAESNIT